jgi:hypothetical protein
LIFILALVSARAEAQSKPRRTATPYKSANEQKTKLAEGRYQLNGGPASRGFQEPWTLYRTNIGYQLEEQWIVPLPAEQQQPPTVIDVNVQMVTGLRPTQIRIGAEPSQALTCNIALNQMFCSAHGQTNKLEMKGAYDYFLPSPWMLGNIVRRAKKNPDIKPPVQLVRIDGNDENGVQLSSFPAEIQYVGDDQIELGGQKYFSSIYELRSENSIPGMLVWISQEGIVLAIQDSTRPEQRIELSQLKVYGKF